MVPSILAVLVAAPSATAGEPSRMERMFADCAGWMPEQYSEAMKQVEAIGADAVPELVALLEGETDSDRLWPICEALGRVPDSRALPALGPQLSHADWLVRSACGMAYARGFAVSDRREDDLRPLLDIVQVDPQCSVRTNIAGELGVLAEPRLRVYFEQRLFAPELCAQQVAMHGLAGTPEPDEAVGSALLRLFDDPAATDDIRETAAWALTEFHHPPARKSLLLYLQTGDKGRNARAFAIEALGHVGLPEDVSLLHTIIDTDPYGGDSVWAVHAREAIVRIERRAAGQE